MKQSITLATSRHTAAQHALAVLAHICATVQQARYSHHATASMRPAAGLIIANASLNSGGYRQNALYHMCSLLCCISLTAACQCQIMAEHQVSTVSCCMSSMSPESKFGECNCCTAKPTKQPETQKLIMLACSLTFTESSVTSCSAIAGITSFTRQTALLLLLVIRPCRLLLPGCR